jgi:YHS domain-containing protein
MSTQIKKQGDAKKTAQDPVCGANVDMETSLKDVIQKDEFYFCSEECRQKFRGNPSSGYNYTET